MQFLVKWPTRSRAKQFVRCFERWLACLSFKHGVHFLVNQDTDDPARLEVYRLVAGMRGPGLDIIGPDGGPLPSPATGRLMPFKAVVTLQFIEGAPKTKIEAVNFGMEQAGAFDVLVNGSDDMFPEASGFDEVIASEMQRHWPGLDGALNFWDGSTGKRDLCTLTVMGRELYRRFGYIYHPAYVSLYADDEYTQVCRLMGRMADPEGYRPGQRVLVRHKHPALTGSKASYDALMVRNESFYAADLATFQERKARAFDYRPGAPVPRMGELPAAHVDPAWRPTLSVLICGLECRRALAAKLLRALEIQKNALAHPDDVEILYRVDAGVETVGAKRNALLAAASKEWIAFFDDDDRPMGDYLDRILEALAAGGDTRSETRGPDVVGITGICVMNAGRAFNAFTTVHLFRHGLEFGMRQQTEHYVVHRPFPISVFRAVIARQCAFPEQDLQEDDVWATEVRPLLKTEVKIYDPIYLYDWRAERTATQAAPNIAKARATGADRAWQSPSPAGRVPRPAARVNPVRVPAPAPVPRPAATPPRWALQSVAARPTPRTRPVPRNQANELATPVLAGVCRRADIKSPYITDCKPYKLVDNSKVKS